MRSGFARLSRLLILAAPGVLGAAAAIAQTQASDKGALRGASPQLQPKALATATTDPLPSAPQSPTTTPTTTPAARGAGAAGATTPVPRGKEKADTTNLPQFEQGVEFEPRSPNYKVSFSLEDADLAELVRVISQLTGKRFIFGGKVRSIKATVYSPQKVTVAEAYQAFLAILETNGLTVVPHGRFLKIIETSGVAMQGTPMYSAQDGDVPREDRYVTRLHRMQHVAADEVANVLNKFKTKDGDVTTYAPGNLIIITDTGSNIKRLMGLVDEIDVGGAGDQVWIEPVHYGAASDLATRINEIFDLKGGGAAPAKGAPGAPGGPAPSGELHVAKVVADDRTNSLVIVATERAYLRILEFLKRIDLPQTGEGEIHVLPLQHADATELSKTLQEIVTAASAPPGGRPAGGAAAAPPVGIFEGTVKVSADKATNSVVVTSSLRDYASLHAVIDRLDQPRRQVFIEAVIMDLSINRSTRLGLAFHGGVPIGDNNQNLLLGGFQPGTSVSPFTNQDVLTSAALGLRGEAIPNSQTLSGTGISIPAFGAVITALADEGDADVLSTPHILATDNVAAEINVGENVPLQQAGGGIGALSGAAGAAGAAALGGLGGFGGFSPQRQDVGTKIKIVPHMNQSDEVRLELTEEISEAREPQGALQVVPITKRTVNTQLVIKDQQTVVIGGLMRNRVVNSKTKVPILGDIPVLGALFRKSSTSNQKTNLVLVLTPYIIREQADLRAVFERKMQERQEFLDRYFVFADNEYTPPKDYSRTNGLVEEIRQAYLQNEERRRLDELTRPKELKTHQPGDPLQMPAPVKSGSPAAAPGAAPPASPGNPGRRGGGGAPGGATPAPTPTTAPQTNAAPLAPVGAPPSINVPTPVRTVERVER